MKYQLDFKEIETKEDLHEYLKNKLFFPEYYGCNLDALYDVLTDFSSGTIIEIENFNLFQKKEKKYCDALLSVFEEVKDNNSMINIIINS